MKPAASAQDRVGLVAMYRWRLHPGREAAFIAAWSAITLALREHGGSFGSRLHCADDGTWVGYAQWPDDSTRQRAFDRVAVDPALSAQMRNAIAESLPELLLQPVADFLVPAIPIVQSSESPAND
jgi:hypothetical protein